LQFRGCEDESTLEVEIFVNVMALIMLFWVYGYIFY